MKEIDLTSGSLFGKLIKFSLPMIVGKYIGANALASVGSVYYSYGMGTLEELTKHIFH